MDCIEVFRQAEKEIAESGKLSLTARLVDSVPFYKKIKCY